MPRDKGDGEWEPIMYAPTNGSMILVCLTNQMNLIVRARYDRVHKHWLSDYEGEGGVSRVMFFQEGDYWMPMPKPPKVSHA